MTIVGLQAPRMPEPPEQIDRRYMIDLVRAIEVLLTKKEQHLN